MEERKPENKRYGRKAVWIAVTALSALILFCMLTDGFILMGFGRLIRGVFVGLFGAAGYAWVAAFTAYSALKISGKRLNVPLGYCINFIAMAAVTVLLVQLITSRAGGGTLDAFTFGEYLRYCYAEAMSFGGVLAALIVFPVYKTVGAVGAYSILALVLTATVYFTSKFFADRKAGDAIASMFLETKVTGHASSRDNTLYVENLNAPVKTVRVETTEEPRPKPVRARGEAYENTQPETDRRSPAGSAKDILFGGAANDNAKTVIVSAPADNAAYTELYSGENLAKKTGGGFETAPLSVFDNQRPPKILHTDDPIPPIITDQNPLDRLFGKREGAKDNTPPQPKAKPRRDLSEFKEMIVKDIDETLPPIVSGDALMEQRRDAASEKHNGAPKDDDQAEDIKRIADLTSPIRKKAEPLGNAVFGYASSYENPDQEPIVSDFSRGGGAGIDTYQTPVGQTGKEDDRNGSVSSILSDMFKGREGMTSDKDAFKTAAVNPLMTPLSRHDDSGFSPARKPFSNVDGEEEEDFYDDEKPENKSFGDFFVENKSVDRPVERTKTIAIVERPLSGGAGMQMSLEERESLPELPLRKNKYKPYVRPSIELLDQISENSQKSDDLIAKGKKLEEGIAQFGIQATVKNIISGPTVALFEMELAAGISVKQLMKYSDDLARHIESRSGIRIISHIPGKSYFGIEAPHNTSRLVALRELIGSKEFKASVNENRLYFTLGVDVQGTNIIADLSDMPHLLVAGSTGTGKSVLLNSLILSLLYKYSPDELRFILVDPKRVEFHMFNGMPHMLLPNAVVEPDKALNAFNYLIDEMERRYIVFQQYKVKDLASFNKLIDPKVQEPFPRIVLIVDELSDLMSFNKSEIESKILRLAQKARASGIHLVLATQRPSVDVITGTIKSNLPARIALRVISQNDSKTILDTGGPEKLLGKGDMLYQREGAPHRVQGAYVSVDEVMHVVDFVKSNNECNYSEEAHKEIIERKPTVNGKNAGEEKDSAIGAHSHENDPLFVEALRHVILANAASISMIQRKLNVGFGRAGNIIEAMEKMGFVSASEQNKARSVLVTKDMFNDMYGDEFGEI